MAHSNIEADKMLDVYIHDYLMKRKFGVSARTFQVEAQLLTNRVAIDAPGGFLLEWWSVFWDIFIARFKTPLSSTSASYNVGHMINTLEHKDVQAQRLNQMQQLIQQKQLQGYGTQLLRGTTNEAMTRHSLGTTNALTKRVYESNPQVQRILISVANKKPTNPRDSDNIDQHLDANHSCISKAETFRDQHTRQTHHSFPGDNLRFYPPLADQAHQFPVTQLDQSLTNMIIPAVSLKAAESGSDHGVNSLLLKGWPLMGLEQLQSGLIQQQSSTVHLSHPSQQQLQQQILMFLSDQYMDISQGDQSNFTANIVVDRNLPVQVDLPLFSRSDSAMQMKEVQNINQSLEQGQRPALFCKHPKNSSSSSQQQDKSVATGSTTMDVSLSNTFRGDDQKYATRKRKQLTSSGQINSIGTAYNISLLPSSVPSTPSISIAEDVISMPALLHDDNFSKGCVYGNDVVYSATLVSTQTVDVPLINHMFASNSAESFLSDNADTESIIPRRLGTSKDITVLEIGSFHSSAVNCCNFSSDGKLIATGGDKEVVLRCTDSRAQKHILEGHSDAITDVRFGPRLPRLASSSLDKTIKIWDVHNPDHSIRSFTGHSASVISLDFHPTKEDLICSCDNVSTIRYWSIENGGCAGVSKVRATQVRFQPNLGKYLAAADADGVLLFDVETTQICRYPLKGHISIIRGICWSSSGEYLASVSEDTVKVWKIGSSGEQECMHERSVTGKRFRCCTFHPCYPSVLVVGSDQCLEFWHMAENKMMIVLEEPVNSLAASQPTGVVASATDNNLIRLWK
ncbi:transcriptional corepressor LEUNIG-like isoform X2 [Solanum pennellii]|uniref:Transcriptional corepressor LEUNIG-like isoform X2 n=1 Tax=Solanum pennellii TaxID=28526 RepID=A0ABM1GRI4_SOLPN|nr:transcriptional corepressor LEUNIG-like isoform X2 [Solanum pennellii]